MLADQQRKLLKDAHSLLHFAMLPYKPAAGVEMWTVAAVAEI
jgi:hypothetical protein